MGEGGRGLNFPEGLQDLFGRTSTLTEMTGMRLDEEDEVKPRNRARIDCAKSHNTRSHKKLQKMAGIFAARWTLSAGYSGGNLQFLRQRSCRKFLRGHSQTKRFGGWSSRIPWNSLVSTVVSPCSPPATASHRRTDTSSSSLCPCTATFLSLGSQVAQIFATGQKSQRCFGKQTDITAWPP